MSDVDEVRKSLFRSCEIGFIGGSLLVYGLVSAGHITINPLWSAVPAGAWIAYLITRLSVYGAKR